MYDVVAMEPLRESPGPKSKYPFPELKVGQGFRAPIRALSSVRATASRLKRDTGKRFVCNKDGEHVAVCRVE